MTEHDKMELTRSLLDVDGYQEDELIAAYLDVAAGTILRKAFPFDDSQTEVPEQYARLQCEIAVFMYNKRGAEGQSSHSEGGVTRAYEGADIPKSMLASIVPRAKVI